VIPEHVAFYNRATLSALMAQAGFGSTLPLTFLRAYPANLVVEEFNVWPAILRRLGDRDVAFPGYMVALSAFAESAPQS
jgi:hypothetical protein